MNIRFLLHINYVTMFLLLINCVAYNTDQVYSPPIKPYMPQNSHTITSLIKQYPTISKIVLQHYMTLSNEEKIAQLMIIRLQDRNGEFTKKIQSLEQFEKKFPFNVGGYILFKKNISSIEQLSNLITNITLFSKINPFISIDVEGGTVNRFRHLSDPILSHIPSARKITSTKTMQETRAYMKEIGLILKKIGINMNFAPVADISYPNTNKFLISRIFSDNTYITANYTSAVNLGLRDAGIISVFKHFPGHGGAKEDSHYELASIPMNRETLENNDWLPYKLQIPLGLDAIMFGHVALPAFNISFATASPDMINILKKDLQFNGVLITDSLHMQAVWEWQKTQSINIEEQILRSGIDILLEPRNYIHVIQQLTTLFTQDKNFEKLITQKVLRILQIKLKYNIL